MRKEMPFLENFKEAWNIEFGATFPMTSRLLDEKITTCPHVFFPATLSMNDDLTPQGFIITKTYQGDEDIPSYKDVGFIAMIYVFPRYRKQGIGYALLSQALKTLKAHGITRVYFGTDMHNFFPGVPEVCLSAGMVRLCEKTGFIPSGNAYDLWLNKMPQIGHYPQYRFEVAQKSDETELKSFMKEEFSARWYAEVSEYFALGGTGREFVILKDQSKIIAFARINDLSSIQQMHNINWAGRFKTLGGIGPLGVAKDYRKQRLGEAITKLGVRTLFERGCTDVIVDWTGITEFYEKLGFRKDSRYVSYEVRLNTEDQQ